LKVLLVLRHVAEVHQHLDGQARGRGESVLPLEDAQLAELAGLELELGARVVRRHALGHLGHELALDRHRDVGQVGGLDAHADDVAQIGGVGVGLGEVSLVGGALLDAGDDPLLGLVGGDRVEVRRFDDRLFALECHLRVLLNSDGYSTIFRPTA